MEERVSTGARKRSAAARAGLGHVPPTMVGRARELGLLAAGAVRPPSLVLVEGEAGIGKTRLVEELLSNDAVGGRRVLVGRCHQVSQPFFLGPIVEALRSSPPSVPFGRLSPVAGAARALVPELAPHLPRAPRRLGNESAERHRIFRAVAELLGAWGPAVCVLEDLHWGDTGTFDFLSFLVSQPPEGLAVVLTYRGEDLRPTSALRSLSDRVAPEILTVPLQLSALTLPETRVLTASSLQTDRGCEELATQVYERTQGVPLAIREVLRVLRDRSGAAALGSGLERLAGTVLPPSIRDSALGRISQLSADARLVTRAAAVLGMPASERLIAAVAGLPPRRGVNALVAAVSSTLLEEDAHARYGFRRELAREAVYDAIPAPERRRLHLRAAHALDARHDARSLVERARHYRRAGRPRQSTREAEAAAKAAIAAGDERSAARLLEEELDDENIGGAARIRLAIALGRAALYSPSPQRAIELLLATLAEERMPVTVRGELRFSVARLLFHAGDSDAGHAELKQALEDLKRRPGLAARAMVNLALSIVVEGLDDDPMSWLARAAEAVERQDDPVARIAVLGQRAATLLSFGEPAGWEAVGELPVEVGSVEEKVQLLRAYFALSVAAHSIGHFNRSVSFLAEARRCQEELSHASTIPWLDTAAASLDWSTGRWDGLRVRALELMNSTTTLMHLSLRNRAIVGSLMLSSGQVEEAERILVSAVEEAQVTRAAWPLPAWARLAEICLSREDRQRACEMAATAVEGIRRRRAWACAASVMPVATEAFRIWQGRRSAYDLVTEFAAALDGRDAPAADAALAVCRAVIAEFDDDWYGASRLLALAERTWSGLPAPYEAARARERHGLCLLAGGERAGGDLLVGALESFEALGASWDCQRVLTELRSSRVTLPYPGRGEARDGLTRREAQVAKLAGMGQTNRQIAETLCISPRTAEVHVASALRKMGTRSRRELARLATAERHEVRSPTREDT